MAFGTLKNRLFTRKRREREMGLMDDTQDEAPQDDTDNSKELAA